MSDGSCRLLVLMNWMNCNSSYVLLHAIFAKKIGICKQMAGNRSMNMTICHVVRSSQNSPIWKLSHWIWYPKRMEANILSFCQSKKKDRDSILAAVRPVHDCTQLCKRYIRVLFTRIVGKISVLTIFQYLNCKNEQPIGRIKYALI